MVIEKLWELNPQNVVREDYYPPFTVQDVLRVHTFKVNSSRRQDKYDGRDVYKCTCCYYTKYLTVVAEEKGILRKTYTGNYKIRFYGSYSDMLGFAGCSEPIFTSVFDSKNRLMTHKMQKKHKLGRD